MDLGDLRQPLSREEVLGAILAALRDKGFPVDDWHPGGVTRTLLEAIAAAISDLAAARIPALAESGLLAYAKGADLDRLAENVFGLARHPAVFARGRVRFLAEPGAGPFHLPAGRVWVGSAGGLRYVTEEAATVPAGGHADVLVRAEEPGDAYNLPPGAIDRVLTPMPGLSVTNPSGWLVEAGRPAETDEELRERCRLSWAKLGYAHPAEAYRAWALESTPGITKAAVFSGRRGPGTVDVVVWGDGGVGSADLAAADAYIQARRDLVADVRVKAATPRTVTVAGAVYLSAGTLASARPAVEAALSAYARRIPIGGEVQSDALAAAIRSVPEVLDVDLTSPSADVALADEEAAVLDLSGLAYFEV